MKTQNLDAQKKLAKIFVLIDLLVQELDNPIDIPNDEALKIRDESKRFMKVIEPTLNMFYKNKEVRRTTFFTTLQNKFCYIFDKEYKR